MPVHNFRLYLDELPPPAQRMFDPQLYLAGLRHDDCETAINRLVTYPWFTPDIPERQQAESATDWEHRVAEAFAGHWGRDVPSDVQEIERRVAPCLEFQQRFGVSRLILPSPLTVDPESDYGLETNWLDVGLQAVQPAWQLPALASVAISDSCLANRPPEENDLLRAITDQVLARPVQGVYLVIHQVAPPETPFIIDGNVARSVLRLCYDFGVRGAIEVVVNYVDVFGVACLAAGAKAFASGPTTKSKRLCFSDFETREGG